MYSSSAAWVNRRMPGRILQERSPSGTTRTVQGPGIDRPLASVDSSGTVSYYLADHLGSIVQQTDASAAVTITRRYDPYGVPWAGASTSGYAFTGREWDAETQLYYYRARFYDPARARFLSEDPIGLAGGGNLYRYVENAPTRLVDPLGLQSLGVASFELREWFTKWFPRQKASDRQTQMETVLKLEEYLQIAEVLSVAGAMAISLFEGNVAVASEERLACTAQRGTRLLSQFPSSTIDEVVENSARLKGSQITEGARAIAKKLGHAGSGGYNSAFEGIAPTPTNAESLIRNIMSSPIRTVFGSKSIDIYNAAGQAFVLK